MGFLQAIQQMGQSENKQGLEPYLVRPMSQDGKEIRVWLKVQGDWQDVLDIVEVSRMDLADYKAATAPLKKYLYKKPPANTTSSFTPIHLTGKMKKDPQKLCSIMSPQWEEKKTHFASMKTRILDAYEREGVFTPGSVERIFRGMQEKIDMVLPDLDNQHSYMVVFVIDENGRPIYPGEVPAFEKYFVRKLEQSLGGDNRKTKKGVSPSQPPQKCNICGEELSGSSTNLDKAFKFATFDKLSLLPGLDKKEIPYSYAVCKTCFEQIASGREKTDRLLTRRGMLSDIQVWAIPEAIGSEAEGIFENFYIHGKIA